MTVKSIASLLSLKETLFNYKDAINDTLLCQGFILQTLGYEIQMKTLAAVIPKESGCKVSLRTIYRSIQQSSGLHLLGPLKYWSDRDLYLFTIKSGSSSYSEEVLLTGDFDQFIHCPFSIESEFCIQLKVISFGNHNLHSWNHYLSLDYDAVAISLQHEILEKHSISIPSGINPLLRDVEFLNLLSREPKARPYAFLKNHFKSLLLKEKLLWIIGQNKIPIFKDVYRLNFHLTNDLPLTLLKWKLYQKVFKTLFLSILKGLPFKF